MLKWENVMRQAKQAFDDKVFSVAIYLNKEALDVARDGFNEQVGVDPEKAVASVMVSCFSLADSYIQIRDFEKAYQAYQRSFAFLKMIIHSPNQTPALEAAVYHAVSHLKHEWYLFNDTHAEELEQLKSLDVGEFHSGLSNIQQTSLVNQIH